MSMLDWAKREVELACKCEATGRKDGEKVEVNRYFKKGDSIYGCWDEITAEEFAERKEMDRKRRESMNG